MFNINEIKKSFSKVVKKNFNYTDDGLKKSIDDIFDAWINRKKKFIDAFGGELIYKLPDETEPLVDPAMKIIGKESFCLKVDNLLNGSSMNFSDYIHYTSIFSKAMAFISNNDFYNNHLSEDFKLHLFDKKMKLELCTFKAGIRISKIFRTIFEGIDSNTVDKIQVLYSTYIQKNKIKGHLYLSVHPLDFLSASENVHNWRSCHSLDGDYGIGNIQYMKDSTTFIGYLLPDDKWNYNLPNFPKSVMWNSKIWRSFFFLQDDILMRGNSYPYDSKKIVDLFASVIANLGLIPADSGASWHVLDEDDNYYDIKEKFLNPSIHQLYFNDLVDHSKYIPTGYFNEDKYPTTNSFPKFTIGDDLLCFTCGKNTMLTCDGDCCSTCRGNDF